MASPPIGFLDARALIAILLPPAVDWFCRFDPSTFASVGALEYAVGLTCGLQAFDPPLEYLQRLSDYFKLLHR